MGRMRFTVEQRFADLDLMGHVNNVAYLTYLQELRLKLLYRLLGDTLAGMNQVVVRNEIDYLVPLGLSEEPLGAETWVESMGRSSYVIACEIIGPSGAVAARGRTWLVYLDGTGMASTPIPDDARALLSTAMDDK